jgi:hypothetical protein
MPTNKPALLASLLIVRPSGFVHLRDSPKYMERIYRSCATTPGRNSKQTSSYDTKPHAHRDHFCGTLGLLTSCSTVGWASVPAEAWHDTRILYLHFKSDSRSLNAHRERNIRIWRICGRYKWSLKERIRILFVVTFPAGKRHFRTFKLALLRLGCTGDTFSRREGARFYGWPLLS